MTDGTLRREVVVVIGGLVTLGAWTLRGACPAHGLPVIDPPENWIGTFAQLQRASGWHVLEPLARGVHFGLLHLEYLLSFVLLRVQGTVSDFASFDELLVQDPAPLWVLARVVTATVGAATVALLFLHARRLLGWGGATVAALLLAVSPLHVELSRRVAPEAVQVLVVFAALALIADAAERRRPVSGPAFLLFGAAALRTGATGIVLAVPFLVSVWVAGGPRALLSVRGVRVLAVAAAIALAAALVPQVPESAAAASGADGGARLGPLGASLLRGAGPPVTALAVLGALLTIRSGRRGPQLHALYVVLAALVLAARPSAGGGAATVLLPSVCLLAAFGLRDLTERLRGPAGLGPALTVVVLAVLLAGPLRSVVNRVRLDCAADTRQLAAAWVREHVEPRAIVAIAANPQLPWEPIVPLPDLKRNLKDRAALGRSEHPEGGPYWDTLLRTRSERKYDLRLVEGAEAWESAAAYRGREVAIAVIPLHARDETGSAAERLRAQLKELPGAELEASFAPFRWLTRGPRLEVWQITPPEERTPVPPGGDPEEE